MKLYGNSLVSSARLLLETGADPNATDSVGGDTALLHVRHLLRRGLFAEAAQVAEAVLASAAASPSLPNRVNAANRTLLSYAVACGDAAVDLTRYDMQMQSRQSRLSIRLINLLSDRSIPPLSSSRLSIRLMFTRINQFDLCLALDFQLD